MQARKQSGKNFKILEIPYIWPKDLSNLKNYKIGFDPKLFTENTLHKYFNDQFNLIPYSFNFNNKIEKKTDVITNLNKSITGEDSKSKIDKITRYLKKNKINYLYVSASENVNWLLNIRGKDLPNSPLVNCKLIITDKGKLYLFINLRKISKSFKKKFKNVILCEENSLFKIIIYLKKGFFCIDRNTCSVFEKQLISSRFNISLEDDPIYNLKSIKNKVEINNTIKAHIEDGVALTKFLFWYKFNNKKITEKMLKPN